MLAEAASLGTEFHLLTSEIKFTLVIFRVTVRVSP